MRRYDAQLFWDLLATPTSWHGFTTVQDASLALEAQTFGSDDHREAVRAFVEKRPPRFQGR